jgi:hypothetical protein
MPKCEEHGHVYGDGSKCPDCAAKELEPASGEDDDKADKKKKR